MNEFVCIPNLPKNASRVIIGEKYAVVLGEALKKHGITPIYIPNSPDVDARLSGHADLNVLHIKGASFVLAKYLQDTEFHRQLRLLGANISFTTRRQGSAYPNDAGLNVCIIGNRFLYCERSSDADIVDVLNKDFAPMKTKQGYANCCVCVVNDNAVITADRGVARVCTENTIDCLCIDSGYVSLDGFEYGFIGGASFKLSSDKLAFTGILDYHPSKNLILDFLDKHHVEPVYLTDMPLFDIGGAIPITENGS